MGDVRFTGKSDFEKVKKDYLDLARHTAKVEAENRKLADTSRRAGRARRDAFGPGATSQLASFAAQLVSVQAAVGGIRQAFQFAREEEEKALDTLKRFTDQTVRLNQIATSAEDLAAMQARADQLAIKYAVEPEQVRRVMFSARSEGFEKSLESVLRLSQVLVDVEAGAGVAGQLPQLFAKQKLTPEEALNMVFVGARQSRLDFEQISAAIPRIAEGGALLGASPAETVAVASVMASRFASGKTASMRAKAFATKAGLDERLKGKGFAGTYYALRDEFTPEERKAFLGESQELNAFYAIMEEEVDRVNERRKRVAVAQERGMGPEAALSQAVRRAEVNPRLTAQRERDTARIRREVERLKAQGVPAAKRATAIDDMMSAFEAEHANFFAKWAGYGTAQTVRLFGGREKDIAAAGMAVGGLFTVPGGDMYPEERFKQAYDRFRGGDSGQMREAIDRQTRATEANTRALQNTRPSGVTRAAALAEAEAQKE